MAKKPATKAEKEHMAMVASLPCAMREHGCGCFGQSTVHHIREGQGLAQRAAHYLTIPLCHECHQGKNGVHGNKSFMNIAKVSELDLLADTIKKLTN
jgi:hypothetical protein